MRSRERVLQSLERVYREAFEAAEGSDDAAEMARLDVEYQRDQIELEVLLDIRDFVQPEEEDKTSSLIEKAQKLRRLAKLR